MRAMMWTNKIALTTAAVIALSGCQTIPMAGVVSGLMGGGASSSGADMVGKQAEVVASFNIALLGLSQANEKMASALGLKDAAELARNRAGCLDTASCTGKEEIESQRTNNEKIFKIIEEKMAEGEALSDDAKAEFQSALLPYGVGVVAGINGAKQAVDSLKDATSDPTQIMRLGTLIYLAKEGPGLLTSFAKTTSAITKYASNQGIDTTSMPSELD